MVGRVLGWVGVVRRVEFPVLLAGLLVAGGAFGLMELADVARDETPHALDTRILMAFREAGDPGNPLGPGWVEEAMRDITALGSTVVLALMTTAAILFLLMTGRPALALFVFAAVAGGQILSSLMKLGIDRPRPELVAHLAEVFTRSFPSGHAMLSAVTYLTLGSLLARAVHQRRTKIFVLGVAVVLTLLVGISRVYLGVHWPSDVLAGWCAGFAWAMLCWLVSGWLLHRPATTNVNGDD